MHIRSHQQYGKKGKNESVDDRYWSENKGTKKSIKRELDNFRLEA